VKILNIEVSYHETLLSLINKFPCTPINIIIPSLSISSPSNYEVLQQTEVTSAILAELDKSDTF
jgi:hypothetical protein